MYAHVYDYIGKCRKCILTRRMNRAKNSNNVDHENVLTSVFSSEGLEDKFSSLLAKGVIANLRN